MSSPSGLNTYADLVQARLEQLLPSDDSKLSQAMRYSCLLPGKRLRPALTMEVCRALCGDASPALDAGCAIEMIHCFSLIHDDLPCIDDDDLRRGAPTCHIKFGEAVALLAGDALFAQAFETLTSLETNAESRIEMVRILSQSSRNLVIGETLDILLEGQPASQDSVQKIHALKTGALFVASCQIGALAAGATPEVVTVAGQFGAHLGLAFQIKDDILNENSAPEELGKATGSDRQRGKQTYPGAFGNEEAERLLTLEVDHSVKLARELAGAGSLLEQLASFAGERKK